MPTLATPLAAGRIAPDKGNYMVGKGFILFKPVGDDFFYHVGNVPTLTVGPKVEKLEHFSSMEGTKLKDLDIVTSKSMELKMTMEEQTAKNLAMLFMGDIDETVPRQPVINIFSAAALTGNLKYYATNEQGPRWYMDLPSVTFTPSGEWSPISENVAQMEVTGSVDSVAGVFGTLQLAEALGTIEPEAILDPFVDSPNATDFVPQVDDPVVAYIGAFIGALSFTYQWNADGTPIYGATEKEYTPLVGDIGKALSVTVTASNLIGDTVVTSEETDEVVAAA